MAGRLFAAAKCSLKCKKNVAATLLETRLLYCSEAWPPLPLGHAKRLEGVQMRWTRKAEKLHHGEGCRETDAQISAEFSIATGGEQDKVPQVGLSGAVAHGLPPCFAQSCMKEARDSSGSRRSW